MTAQYPNIASGFKEDCLQLLSIFKEEDDIRFKTFCKCWQKMKFSLVFLCRESFPDLLEFCEEVLHIAKQFVLLPYQFKERIGGLYLLYGLYYKMPLDNFVKIRITLADFNQIMELHKQIRDGEHLDANYILSKMFVDSAFIFCMYNKEMGLNKQYNANRQYTVDNHLSVYPYIYQMNKSNGLLQKIKELSKHYEEEKTKFSNYIGCDKTVQLFDSCIIDNMMTDFQSLNKSRSSSFYADESNPRKKNRKRLYKIRPVLGHGFDTDSSDEENREENEDNDENNENEENYENNENEENYENNENEENYENNENEENYENNENEENYENDENEENYENDENEENEQNHEVKHREILFKTELKHPEIPFKSELKMCVDHDPESEYEKYFEQSSS